MAHVEGSAPQPAEPHTGVLDEVFDKKPAPPLITRTASFPHATHRSLLDSRMLFSFSKT